jgi:hypothetical protein
LHAGQLEAEGANDMSLFDSRLAVEEQGRLRLVIGKLLGLAAHLVFLTESFRERREAARACLDHQAF